MSTVCRVCLTGGSNVKLCWIEDVRLLDVYNRLTNTQFYAEDGRPSVVCSFCYQKLQKCRTLLETATKSEEVCSFLLDRKLEVTMETIKKHKLETKEYLNVVTLNYIELGNEAPKNFYANFIKEEATLLKENETAQVIKLVETQDGNYLLEYSTEQDTERLQIEKDSDKLTPDQKPSQIPRRPKSVHTEVKPNVCNIRDKQFTEESNLVTHMRTHTATKVKPNVCSICDKQFTDESNLETHKRTHTATKVKPNVCSICDKQFTDESNLETHMRTHTATKVKSNVCSICDKQFTEESNLETHMRTHTATKIKPNVCSICDKQFTKKSNLVTHMRTHSANLVKPKRLQYK